MDEIEPFPPIELPEIYPDEDLPPVTEAPQPLRIDGQLISSLSETLDDGTLVVELADKRRSYIPATHPLATRIAELDLPQASPKNDEINIERDRRAATMTFQNRLFQTDAVSQQNIIAMGTAAKFALLKGAQAGNYRWAAPDADFSWIAADNTLMKMDAPTMSAFADAAAAHVTRMIFAARALKDLSPPPADYQDDKYWPS